MNQDKISKLHTIFSVIAMEYDSREILIASLGTAAASICFISEVQGADFNPLLESCKKALEDLTIEHMKRPNKGE